MKIIGRLRGFSLLEVLVTIVIVGTGLLGVAALMLTALKVNQGAQLRSQASWLAHDIIESIRANRLDKDDYVLLDCSSAPTGATVVSKDLAHWCAALAVELPDGTGSVSVAGDVVRVVVQWNDSRAGGDDSQQFEMETRLYEPPD